MGLSLVDIQKSYGGNKVLDGFSLEAEEGDFLAVLGRSGCGKSTFLRLAGGIEPPDGGKILLDGKAVTAPGKEIMMIFQDPNQLFPWKTLLGNVTFAIRKTRPHMGRSDREELARSCLAEVGLEESAGQYPHQLSGGMKQRGALARALALESRVLLMDEPFCSLDYLTRKNAQETLLRLWRQRRMTVVFVTHDIEEALVLAGRVAVFDNGLGRIGQIFENDGSDHGLRERLEGLLLAEGERGTATQ